MKKIKINQLITYNFLKKHGACSRALKIFKEVFPTGMKLNEKNLEKYLEHDNATSIDIAILMDILTCGKKKSWEVTEYGDKVSTTYNRVSKTFFKTIKLYNANIK